MCTMMVAHTNNNNQYLQNIYKCQPYTCILQSLHEEVVLNIVFIIILHTVSYVMKQISISFKE